MTDGLELRGKPRSVRRFNRRALIGIVGAVSVIVLGAAAFALRSPDRSGCLLYTSPSPRDQRGARMPSSA